MDEFDTGIVTLDVDVAVGIGDKTAGEGREEGEGFGEKGASEGVAEAEGGEREKIKEGLEKKRMHVVWIS